MTFRTEDALIQKLYDTAEEKCKGNHKQFGDYKVLIEGGGYEKVWIETQPMGGAMYAKRDLEIAYNNQKIFMDHQREDGRLPGSIEYKNGRLIPQFNKFQGFCFPEPALDVYYLTGKDPQYLQQLYEVLRKYDEYLWTRRDSDGDGCLESWCKYDTGEDNAVRYGDAPDAWEEEVPPADCQVVPMASMDFMSYSYTARDTMAAIAKIMGNRAAEETHLDAADKVKKALRTHFWDEKRGAFFDLDKNHRKMPVLVHNNLRTMYWHSMEQKDADRFVKEHLLNPEEFWTKLPLPSVAANDPMYRNDAVNNWSGQAQALTYQRAIGALEKYGYAHLIPKLGSKLFQAIGENCIFVQQYDPFTMVPSPKTENGDQDAYGPAMLSVLEYISRMYGVHICRDSLIWSCVSGADSVYTQSFDGHIYSMEAEGELAVARIDGKEIFSRPRGFRVETDLEGKEIHGAINL